MGLFGWLFMGLVVGVLAKWIMPGRDPGGVVVTILLGMGGALVGGFVASLLGLGTVTGFNLGSVLIATLGALVILYSHRRLKESRGSQ